MPWVQRLRRWGNSRRLTALSLLIVAAWMLFPLSIQAPPSGPEKDDSAPFPCQNRPCGCKTAAQCWKKCCCFTNAQKLTWAKSHGVRPPEYVADAAAKEAVAKPGVRSCCQQAKSQSCCDKTPTRTSRVTLVVALDELRCQGIDTSLIGFPTCVPPPAQLRMPTESIVFHSVGQWAEECLAAIDIEPPTPPPKLAI